MRSWGKGLRWLLVVALAGTPLAFGKQPEGERLYVTQHEAMAATWTLYLYAPSETAAAGASDAAFAEVDRINDLLSNYSETSELSRINRLAAQELVTTDPETFAFLEAAQHWSAVSNGAFDITVGALMKSWGFFRKQGQVPTAEQMRVLRSETGWAKMRLDAATRGVRFTAPGVELDPGGIGKGFAVDAVLRVLRESGVAAAEISAGSSTIGTMGAPPGKQGWPVVVHDPWQPSHEISTVTLRDETLSTANCVEKNFILAGHLYCHIMDPRTQRPVQGVLQVTVVDPSGTSSDALSNVLFVNDAQRNAKLLRRLPHDRALVLTGTRGARVCHTMRWSSPIAEGFCKRAQ